MCKLVKEVIELIETFNFGQIVFFICLLAAAVKGAGSFLDWLLEKVKISRDKDFKKRQQEQENKEIKSDYEELKQQLSDITRIVAILIDSDKDDIKSWITEKHHYFCYEKGYIDDYSLDCMEKRFKHYQDENGNSFVEDLMRDVRNLPKVSMNNTNINKKQK